MSDARRTRVMSPWTRAALELPTSTRRRPPRPERPDTSENLAALAVTLRVQRRLALRTMALVLGGLVLLPVALDTDQLRRIDVLGIPVVWLVLGVGTYPVLLLLAHRHRRAVDRLEDALATRDAGPPH